MKPDTLASIAADPEPSPDTAPQTPCDTPLQLWRYADAPERLRSVLERWGDGRTGRWVMLVPAVAVAAWEPDLYDSRPVALWAEGWERMQQIALSLDHVANPLYFKGAEGILIFGCSA